MSIKKPHVGRTVSNITRIGICWTHADVFPPWPWRKSLADFVMLGSLGGRCRLVNYNNRRNVSPLKLWSTQCSADPWRSINKEKLSGSACRPLLLLTSLTLALLVLPCSVPAQSLHCWLRRQDLLLESSRQLHNMGFASSCPCCMVHLQDAAGVVVSVCTTHATWLGRHRNPSLQPFLCAGFGHQSRFKGSEMN